MSRSYKGVRPKSSRVYAASDVMQLYAISRNTVTNWISKGLRPVDDRQPQLFRGAELKRFRENLAAAARRPLPARAFECWPCGARVIPHDATLFISRLNLRGLWAVARCPSCNQLVRKPINETQCDELQTASDPNTTADSRDGYTASIHGGIGKDPDVHWTARNERIVHAYQIYGGRHSNKTVDAHLLAIRDFEAFHKGRDFGAITVQDAADYREHLVNCVDSKSRSTLQHRSAHLRTFFRWLGEQDGYKRQLNKTICDYFILPKKAVAKALGAAPKSFPSTEDLQQMLRSAPTTLVQRRDRAIFAASFLFGTRSDATASLRVGFVDVSRKLVTQDATRMRIKNSKSQTTFWFPVDPIIPEIVISWIDELRELGCRPEDALFPPDQALAYPRLLSKPERLPIKPWSTDARSC